MLQLSNQAVARHEWIRVVQQPRQARCRRECKLGAGPPGLSVDRPVTEGGPETQGRRPGCGAASEPNVVAAETDRVVVGAVAKRGEGLPERVCRRSIGSVAGKLGSRGPASPPREAAAHE